MKGNLLMRKSPFLIFSAVATSISLQAQIDFNNNGIGDIWERVYRVDGVVSFGDPDGDGQSNLEESIAGTDPFDPSSRLKVDYAIQADGTVELSCPLPNPKLYEVYGSDDLSAANWELLSRTVHFDRFSFSRQFNDDTRFFRVDVTDADTDGDGLSDWEEIALGFDPENAHTEYYRGTDRQRVESSLLEVPTLSIHVQDPTVYENWPDPGGFVILREGGLDPVDLQLSYSGTARSNDYTATSVALQIPAGQREIYVPITPIPDSRNEGSETVTVTILPSSDYEVSDAAQATVTIVDSGAGLSEKEAGRFLAQASFGATDADLADVVDRGI